MDGRSNRRNKAAFSNLATVGAFKVHSCCSRPYLGGINPKRHFAIQAFEEVTGRSLQRQDRSDEHF